MNEPEFDWDSFQFFSNYGSVNSIINGRLDPSLSVLSSSAPRDENSPYTNEKLIFSNAAFRYASDSLMEKDLE